MTRTLPLPITALRLEQWAHEHGIDDARDLCAGDLDAAARDLGDVSSYDLMYAREALLERSHARG